MPWITAFAFVFGIFALGFLCGVCVVAFRIGGIAEDARNWAMKLADGVETRLAEKIERARAAGD